MAEVLSQLPAGYCIRLDALHTTATTASTIVEAEYHYLLPVKQNRAHTYAAIEVIATTVPPDSEATEADESHGRRIQRYTEVFPPSPLLQAKWPKLAFVGAVVHRTGERDQQAVEETVYCMGSAPWTAADLLQARRQHWQVENELHWVKDATFEEDYPLLRGGHAPVTWSIFNTFAITPKMIGGG
jgi:predicted transposase YbfD/YdcC